MVIRVFVSYTNKLIHISEISA